MNQPACLGERDGQVAECVNPNETISYAGGIACETCLTRKINDLEALALRDPLTGLPNQRALVANFEKLRLSGEPFGLVYIDLSNFKYLNDTKGHDAGDAALQLAAGFLEGSVRRKDEVNQDTIPVRKGGDEFVVLVTLLGRDDDRGNHNLTAEQRLEATCERYSTGYAELDLVKTYNQQVPEDKQLELKISWALFDYDQDPPMDLRRLLRKADPKGEVGIEFDTDQPADADFIGRVINASAKFARSVLGSKDS